MNSENSNRSLLAIEYPGVVQNVDNMIKTLGGLTNISKVACNMNKKRLDLKFRPDNIFSKPIYGDLKSTAGLLLKVKRRRRKCDASCSSASVEYVGEPNIEILGSVRLIVKFDGICDYQYLPLATHLATNKTEFIYNDIVPSSLLSPDWLTEDSVNQIPYFLPPSAFTRIDTCQEGLFKKDKAGSEPKNTNANAEESTIIGLSRSRRFKHASYIPFSLTAPIPEKPQYQALRMLKYKFVTNDQFNLVKEYLDRQPIWLRSSLAYETKMSRQKLKIILPSVAYYFTTGPWRLMWVRFGYDPRKDFTSRYYQTLDYRIRANTLKEKIARLRSRGRSGELDNTYPYFEQDRLPETRQSFYRYCDVHVPKIQEMLDKIPSPLSGATCNEKTGWLPPNFDDNCREILSETINELLAAQPADDQEVEQSESATNLAAKETAEVDINDDVEKDDESLNEDDLEDDEDMYEDEDRDPTLAELDFDDDDII